ncbi:hypothetical protein [Sphingobium boeckii]|uniref:Uncharacterized protein n=1 Tax=Sphingobium boeckii TaxID=1082345 RepID=A0A7W9AGP6_9SPHN|nr:hypothetical protein [Sphingobium boeckii]MBB5685342.1 hypothetical protein [Sphingobium boeckii]
MNTEEIADLRRWFDASGGIADGRPFLGDRRLDAMVEVMLEMAAQLWVLRRRNTVLESALAAAGTLAADTVEQHQLSPEATATLRTERADFVATIFRSLAELPIDPTPKEA